MPPVHDDPWAVSPFVHASGSAARQRPRDRVVARFASLGLVAVLVAVPSFALWAAITSFQAGAAVQQASDVNGAYRGARYAVAEEESLERKYRLEPSAEVRARHRAAAAAMVTALERASSLGASRGFPDFLHCRDQKRNQHGNDGDDDQQFDERKGGRTRTGRCTAK